MSDSVYVQRLKGRVDRNTARLLDLAQREHLSVADLVTARLPWYEVRNADGGGGTPPTVLIFDEIGGSLGVSAKKFVETIEAIDTPVLRVRINSPGGSVFDAIAIHSALLHHQAWIEVYVDGIAASAASVIAMAGDEVVMMPGSQMMLHDASNLLDGNAEDHRKDSTFLDRQSENIAGMYQRRGGGEVDEWRQIMLAETWAFAAEAVDLGLADRVEVVEVDDREDVEQRRMMRRGFDLSGFGYRYTSREQAPAPHRHRAAAARPVETRSQPRPSAPATATPRMSVEQQIREAGARRAAAFRDRPPAEPPGGQARRVSTGWMHRSLGGTAAEQPMPPRLSAKKVEKDGKQFYVVQGYYTVHERGYQMWDEAGPYVEIVSRGAGNRTIGSNPDTVFLTNHRGLAMARTVAGTLELRTDDVGDRDVAWLNPQRQDVKDLVLGIEDRTITEQSFAFMIDAGHWNGDFTEYRIDEYDIDRGDTSAVNFGANPHTSIAARAREILDELDRLPTGAARAALDVLAHRTDVAQRRDQPAATTAPPAVPPAEADDPPAGRSVSSLDAWLATVGA